MKAPLNHRNWKEESNKNLWFFILRNPSRYLFAQFFGDISCKDVFNQRKIFIQQRVTFWHSWVESVSESESVSVSLFISHKLEFLRWMALFEANIRTQPLSQIYFILNWFVLYLGTISIIQFWEHNKRQINKRD